MPLTRPQPCHFSRRLCSPWSRNYSPLRVLGSTCARDGSRLAGRCPVYWTTGYHAVRRVVGQGHVPFSVRVRTFGTIITTDNAAKTTSSQLLECIDRSSHDDWPTADLTIVMLLTPSFCSYASDVNFIKQVAETLFRRASHDASSQAKFHVVAAVVDRLPDAESPYELKKQRSTLRIADRKEKQPARLEGLEGLAFTLVANCALQSASEDTAAGRHGGIGISGSPRTLQLSFGSLQQQQYQRHHPHQGAPLNNRRGSHEDGPERLAFQIPLADTLFLSGHAQTMMHYEWRKSSGTDYLSLIDVQHLQSAEAHLEHASAHSAKKSELYVDLAAGLVPLTLPQRVHAAMGNVVRQLSDPGNPSIVFPASQQLEDSVASYFKVLRTPPRSVAAWALVFSEQQSRGSEKASHPRAPDAHVQSSGPDGSGLPEMAAIWTSPISMWQDRIADIIARGGRLVKVLSGGGGWGKRAGLLSLDSETSFKGSHRISLDNDVSSSPAFMSGPGATKEGELVQFFIADEQALEPPGQASRANREPAYEDLRSSTLEVGTISSTTDKLLVTESPSSGADRPATLRIRHRCFGALSERGIALMRANHTGKECWTKVDVPHSRVIVSAVPSQETRTRLLSQNNDRNQTESYSATGGPADSKTRHTFHLPRTTRKSAFRPRGPLIRRVWPLKVRKTSSGPRAILSHSGLDPVEITPVVRQVESVSAHEKSKYTDPDLAKLADSVDRLLDGA